MDGDRFDTLTRAAGSRRGVLAGVLGAGALFGISSGTAGKRRHKKPCSHRRIKVTCRERCGTFRNPNSCSRKKHCTCASGKTCLPNRSCGLRCAATADCPAEAGCTCSAGEPNVCLATFTTCEDVPTGCETTADCPFRFVCEETACGAGNTPEKRCVRLCVA